MSVMYDFRSRLLKYIPAAVTWIDAIKEQPPEQHRNNKCPITYTLFKMCILQFRNCHQLPHVFQQTSINSILDLSLFKYKKLLLCIIKPKLCRDYHNPKSKINRNKKRGKNPAFYSLEKTQDA